MHCLRLGTSSSLLWQDPGHLQTSLCVTCRGKRLSSAGCCWTGWIPFRRSHLGRLQLQMPTSPACFVLLQHARKAGSFGRSLRTRWSWYPGNHLGLCVHLHCWIRRTAPVPVVEHSPRELPRMAHPSGSRPTGHQQQLRTGLRLEPPLRTERRMRGATGVRSTGPEAPLGGRPAGTLLVPVGITELSRP